MDWNYMADYSEDPDAREEFYVSEERLEAMKPNVENLEKVIELIDEQMKRTRTPAAMEVLSSERAKVQKSIDLVLSGESEVWEQELWLSCALIGPESIEGLDARYENLEKAYEKIEKEIEEGIRSQEVGEQDLLGIKRKMMRAETQGMMMSEGLEWSDLFDLSDDVNHLLEDHMFPEGRSIRKAFRSLSEEEQMAVLEQAVGDGKISEGQAAWFWAQWR